MRSYVVVTGLPKTIRRQKMVHFLKQFILKKPLAKFLIESLTPISDLHSEMIASFKSMDDAYKAATTLQDFPFQHTDQQIYILKTFMKDNPETQEIAYNKHGSEIHLRPIEHQRPYSPVRSRSPLLNEELSKVELEIELTNRKRMLVEAEHKLLMEQKRLEMLQKPGPSTINTMDGELLIKKQNPPECERKQPQKQNTKSGEKKARKTYWPCRIIRKDMNNHVATYVQFEERPMFNALLSFSLKQRMRDILQGTVLNNTKQTVALYRKIYPLWTDKTFILKLRDMVRQGQMPDELKHLQNIAGSSNANIETDTSEKKAIDPLDLPIEELFQDLDDWAEDDVDTTK